MVTISQLMEVKWGKLKRYWSFETITKYSVYDGNLSIWYLPANRSFAKAQGSLCRNGNICEDETGWWIVAWSKWKNTKHEPEKANKQEVSAEVLIAGNLEYFETSDHCWASERIPVDTYFIYWLLVAGFECLEVRIYSGKRKSTQSLLLTVFILISLSDEVWSSFVNEPWTEDTSVFRVSEIS